MKTFFRLSPQPKDRAELRDRLDSLYHINLSEEPDELPWINEVLFRIYTGETTAERIDPKLWQVTKTKLDDAVQVAFGTPRFGDVNYTFVQQLKKENGIFSAFKNHKQSGDLQALLVDENGKLKPFTIFKKDAEKIVGKYNVQWLKTEHTTAIRSARNAERLIVFRADADLYPNLQYLPSKAVQPRDGHKPYYYIILPLDDPWWVDHTPPIEWNCQCGIDNTDEEPTTIPAEKIDAAPGLGHNPATEERLFNDSHPYYKVSRKEKNSIMTQATSLMIKEKRKEVRAWAKAIISDPIRGLDIPTVTPITKKINLRFQDVKHATNSPHNNYLIAYDLVKDLGTVLTQAEYLGWSPDIKGKPGHLNYHYFKVNIDDKPVYIALLEDNKGKYRIWEVMDEDRNPLNKIKNKA